ncbi:hypothetical protein [Streptomyces sp. enrichment culture]|uniref:hypothetical protein n=1 Tax=Streptomyces sp. enrichment culture TaxID=1795815 RepID=UPI003F54CA1C
MAVKGRELTTPDALFVLAVLFGGAAFIHRIGSSRVELRSDSLVVVNAVGTREIVYAAVRTVGLNSQGHLDIQTVHGESYAPLVFMGSLVDRFVKTSDRAALEIRKRLPDKRLTAEEAPPVRKRLIRPCLPGDVCLALALVAVVSGGVRALL